MNKSLVNKTSRTIDEVDPRWRGLILVSGILLIVIPLMSLYALYLARTLYGPDYPSDAAGYLQLVSQHQWEFSITWILWIVTDFLGIAP